MNEKLAWGPVQGRMWARLTQILPQKGSPSLCLRPSTGLFWPLLLGQQMGIVPSGSSKSDREAMALSSRRETSVW